MVLGRVAGEGRVTVLGRVAVEGRVMVLGRVAEEGRVTVLGRVTVEGRVSRNCICSDLLGLLCECYGFVKIRCCHLNYTLHPSVSCIDCFSCQKHSLLRPQRQALAGCATNIKTVGTF